MAENPWQRIPPEFAYLRDMPPKALERWVADHGTTRSSQLEAQIDGINREPEPGQ